MLIQSQSFMKKYPQLFDLSNSAKKTNRAKNGGSEFITYFVKVVIDVLHNK